MSEELQIADGEPQLIDPRDLDKATACKEVAKKDQEQKDPVWVWVSEGIYENSELKQKWKYERPSIGGKRPFLALGTTNLKLAKEERARRIALRANGIESTKQPVPDDSPLLKEASNPPSATSPTARHETEKLQAQKDAEPTSSPRAAATVTDSKSCPNANSDAGAVPGAGAAATPASASVTGGSSGNTSEAAEPKKFDLMGEVIRFYMDSGYPDDYLQDRPETTRKDEETHCRTLLGFWNEVPVGKAGPGACDRFCEWKLARGVRSGVGRRMINRELNTLNNACKWALRKERITSNPIADRPSYQRSTDVRHCREFMPLMPLAA